MYRRWKNKEKETRKKRRKRKQISSKETQRQTTKCTQIKKRQAAAQKDNTRRKASQVTYRYPVIHSFAFWSGLVLFTKTITFTCTILLLYCFDVVIFSFCSQLSCIQKTKQNKTKQKTKGLNWISLILIKYTVTFGLVVEFSYQQFQISIDEPCVLWQHRYHWNRRRSQFLLSVPLPTT